jgi:DNA replication and repair protein RecF
VHLTSLTLANFRNYTQQEFAFERGPILLLGENAQGKTNVLEAVFLLATGRSERTSGDADLIAWDAREDQQPVARIAGVAARASGDVSVEVAVAGRPGAQGLVAGKRFRLNGVAKRASDVVGAILAVLFTTDDMELVRGAPSGRRRYLDVMLSQADRAYARALSRYNKVVTQRNALLKRIQEGDAKIGELDYWDDELAGDAATLLASRARCMSDVAPAAADAHTRLSGEREELAVAYQPRGIEWTADRLASAEDADVAAAVKERLRATRTRDAAAGVTLSGPHRDDLALSLGGEAASSFASRGQQRTAALALRLAEATYLHERSGERPVLLLDDVLSELDEQRRAAVLAALEADQMLITSADADRFPDGFAAQSWRITSGKAELV